MYTLVHIHAIIAQEQMPVLIAVLPAVDPFLHLGDSNTHLLIFRSCSKVYVTVYSFFCLKSVSADCPVLLLSHAQRVVSTAEMLQLQAQVMLKPQTPPELVRPSCASTLLANWCPPATPSSRCAAVVASKHEPLQLTCSSSHASITHCKNNSTPRFCTVGTAGL